MPKIVTWAKSKKGKCQGCPGGVPCPSPGIWNAAWKFRLCPDCDVLARANAANCAGMPPSGITHDHDGDCTPVCCLFFTPLRRNADTERLIPEDPANFEQAVAAASAAIPPWERTWMPTGTLGIDPSQNVTSSSVMAFDGSTWVPIGTHEGFDFKYNPAAQAQKMAECVKNHYTLPGGLKPKYKPVEDVELPPTAEVGDVPKPALKPPPPQGKKLGKHASGHHKFKGYTPDHVIYDEAADFDALLAGNPPPPPDFKSLAKGMYQVGDAVSGMTAAFNHLADAFKPPKLDPEKVQKYIEEIYSKNPVDYHLPSQSVLDAYKKISGYKPGELVPSEYVQYADTETTSLTPWGDEGTTQEQVLEDIQQAKKLIEDSHGSVFEYTPIPVELPKGKSYDALLKIGWELVDTDLSVPPIVLNMQEVIDDGTDPSSDA